MRDYPTHPLTGTKLKGFQLPNWDKALDVLRRASREMYALPGCRYLGWDIAFLKNGEVSDHRVQLAAGRSKPSSRTAGASTTNSNALRPKALSVLADRKTASTFALWKQFLFSGGKTPGLSPSAGAFPARGGLQRRPSATSRAASAMRLALSKRRYFCCEARMRASSLPSSASSRFTAAGSRLTPSETMPSP